MKRRRATAIRLLGLVAGLLAAAPPGAAADSTPPYTKTSDQTTRATGLGPNRDQYCDVLYDLYVPNSASPSSPVPAILTTNGFGGSKDDQASEADLFARNGYLVLSYSGLGFGGSSCAIEIDSPEWDGRAASHMVDLIAARDDVIEDGPNDPRVGTWGGSYGGGFQFALASVDSRIDAMIPLITWNDLSYSLGPNNDARNFIYTSSPPGASKYEWSELFYVDGNAQPVLNPGTSGWTSGQPPNPACPGFDPEVCVINSESLAAGYLTPDTIAFLRHASAQYEFFSNPNVKRFPPTMLVQGETDTLFTIAEAVANYRGFVSHGAPVKLVLEFGGHSGPSAPGEVNDADPSRGYLDQLWLNWYSHYLKRSGAPTGPRVEYFRDWVAYDPNGSAQPAYGSASGWPVGTTQSWFLSGDGSLVFSTRQIEAGSQTFVNPPDGVPSSYSETSAVQSTEPFSSIPPSDPPGTFAAFSSAPLAADLDSVGIPTLDFSLSATGSISSLPATEVVLFGKIYDVAPDDSLLLVHRLVSPIRIADPSQPVHLNLPGVVHRYPAGHRLRLVLAATDQAYVGSRAPHTITITVDPSTPFRLRLPVLSPVK